MADTISPLRAQPSDLAPHLTGGGERVLFEDVWQRPGLSPRDRSMITLANLISHHRLAELPFHLGKALDNGVTREEIIEMVTHLAFYAGWPTAVSAVAIIGTVFEEADAHD